MNGIFWKLFPIYMPRPHAKFHQNCCTSFGEIIGQETEGHSFIKIIGSKQNFWILGTENFSWSSSQRRGPTPRGDYILAQYNIGLDLVNNAL